MSKQSKEQFLENINNLFNMTEEMYLDNLPLEKPREVLGELFPINFDGDGAIEDEEDEYLEGYIKIDYENENSWKITFYNPSKIPTYFINSENIPTLI